MKSKVFAYIVRQKRDKLELLAFASLDEPGYEVPKGSVEVGESLELAVLREVAEESGITQVEIVKKLGIAVWQEEEQTFFLLRSTADLPDVFEHIVEGQGGDAGFRYQFQWLGLTDELETRLVQGSQAFVPKLLDVFRSGNSTGDIDMLE